MRTLYADQEVAERGTTTWHNPTEHTLRIKIYGTNAPAGWHPKHAPEGRPLVVEPGADVEFDSGYDANMHNICGLLKKGPAPKAAESAVERPPRTPQRSTSSGERPPRAPQSPTES